MKLELACADANILGHLYRSGQGCLFEILFQKVYLDSFIIGEVSRRQPEILSFIEKELDKHSPMMLMDKAELKSRQVFAIYQTELDEMRDLFMPQDEGEKRVIALARATGAGFVLTDDEKQDGPFKLIEQGAFTYLEA